MKDVSNKLVGSSSDGTKSLSKITMTFQRKSMHTSFPISTPPMPDPKLLSNSSVGCESLGKEASTIFGHFSFDKSMSVEDNALHFHSNTMYDSADETFTDQRA